MALEKVQYINEETVISAENLNDIQDSIIALESRTINGKSLTADVSLSAGDVGAAPAGYGLGEDVARWVSNVSADDLVKNGWYAWGSGGLTSNAPFTAGYMLVVNRQATKYLTQIAFNSNYTGTGQTQMVIRTYGTTGWGAWEEYGPSAFAPAGHVKKTFFTIPKNETAIINFSGTANVMIYCRGWAGGLSGVINYTGYAAGSSRQSLDLFVGGGNVSCVLLPESKGQGLAIKCSRTDTTIDVCIDGEVQNNPPTVTFTTEAIEGLSNAETFTRVGHTHTEYAPSGYGLGGSAKSTGNFDTTTACGWYYFSTSSLQSAIPTDIGNGILEVGNRADAQIFQRIVDTNNHKVERVYKSNAWQPWEYVNPPMNLGVEYRTTERCEGKVVYAIRIALGTVGAGRTTVNTNINATGIVRTSNMPVLFETSAVDEKYRINTDAYISGGKMVCRVINGTDNGEISPKITLWYTKD